MEQEPLFERIRKLAKDIDALVADIRGYTYVDLNALGTAQLNAQMLLMALTVAIQGIDHAPSA